LRKRQFSLDGFGLVPNGELPTNPPIRCTPRTKEILEVNTVRTKIDRHKTGTAYGNSAPATSAKKSATNLTGSTGVDAVKPTTVGKTMTKSGRKNIETMSQDNQKTKSTTTITTTTNTKPTTTTRTKGTRTGK
jgi:hypothetical protein